MEFACSSYPDRRFAQAPGGRISRAVVARRLCDLLLSFPSAASGGVQWRTLVHRYEVVHSSRLDISTLGASPLAAATALLWDVLRLVDKEDTDNPVVAVEDAVAIDPRPGFLGTWPSLYATLCKIVASHGTQEHADLAIEVGGSSSSRARGDAPVKAQGLCLSKLKPLLQDHWHANFEESVGYLTDEGTFVRLRKMKHLVQAVLRWRENRVAWRRSMRRQATAVDHAVAPHLDLHITRKYNDLVLRLVHEPEDLELTDEAEYPDLADQVDRGLALGLPLGSLRTPWRDAQPEVFDDPFEPPPELRSYSRAPSLGTLAEYGSTTASSPSARSAVRTFGDLSGMCSGSVTPCLSWRSSSDHIEGTSAARTFGDMSGRCSGSVTPCLSGRSFSDQWEATHSGCVTPTVHSVHSTHSVHSAVLTPAAGAANAAVSAAARSLGFGADFGDFGADLLGVGAPMGGQLPCGDAAMAAPPGNMSAFMPVGLPVLGWNFGLMPSSFLGDRGVIPNGIVEQARAFWESSHAP